VIGPLQRQPSLFGFAFFKELACLQDPTLGKIDLLLDDPGLVAICSLALAGRRQRSMDFGRSTIAPGGPVQRTVSFRASPERHFRVGPFATRF